MHAAPMALVLHSACRFPSISSTICIGLFASQATTPPQNPRSYEPMSGGAKIPRRIGNFRNISKRTTKAIVRIAYLFCWFASLAA